MNARISCALAALLGWTLPALAAGGAGGETQPLPASRLEVAMTLFAGGITMGHMTWTPPSAAASTMRSRPCRPWAW
jgi:hypothetical protein